MKRKTENSYGAVASDRIELLDAATTLVALMLRRKSVHAENGVPGDIDLSRDEQTAYSSALRLLAREFDRGEVDTKMCLTKTVIDQDQEYPADLVADAMRMAALSSRSSQSRGVFTWQEFNAAFAELAELDGPPTEDVTTAILAGRADVVSLPAGHYQVWG